VILQVRRTALVPSIFIVPSIALPSIYSIGVSSNVNAVIRTKISLCYSANNCDKNSLFTKGSLYIVKFPQSFDLWHKLSLCMLLPQLFDRNYHSRAYIHQCLYYIDLYIFHLLEVNLIELENYGNSIRQIYIRFSILR
jgi:hypothetical protein